MSKVRSELGLKGEMIAVTHLLEEGYKIETRNFRCPLGEIDIVAREGKILAFIEVKTRKSNTFGSGAEAVNFKKQQKLNRIALYYLIKNKSRIGPMCRFDVVIVNHSVEKGWSVEIIKDAFPFRNTT